MMYAVHNITNSYNVIEYDFFEVADKLKPKMSEDIKPLRYLMYMHGRNYTLSGYWTDPMEFNGKPHCKIYYFDCIKWSAALAKKSDLSLNSR